MEVEDAETTPRQLPSRKSKSLEQSSGETAQIRPDIDVILSLKEDYYKGIMEGYFRKLGEKRSDSNNNDAEKEFANEALELFKNRKVGDERVRFFKAEDRTGKSHIQVDESAALEKIMADIYRRNESAKRWRNTNEVATGDDGKPTGESLSSRPLPQDARPSGERKRSADTMQNIPTQQASSSMKVSTPKSAKKSKKRKLSGGKKVAPPQSLPFLSSTNANIAAIIHEEETSQLNNQTWQSEEVVNFFRGLYVHGWNEWKKVSAMIKTQDSQNVKAYASSLEKKHPELKTFFSSKSGKRGTAKSPKSKTKKGGSAKKGSGSSTNRRLITAPPQIHDPKTVAASAMGTMQHPDARPMKPKVVICLGKHMIDTEAEPSLIQPSINNRKRPAETLPDYYDPSIRPSVPTNNRQIFIPGNKVYARWLNKGDPGSYGTWYPGYVHATTLAPIQNDYNNTGVPNLLYHVKFEDGAESLDLDTEDIMMADQYLVWLKEIEQYYAMPVKEEMTWKRLTKNTRVYAKWIDPTDPELHGSWVSGKVYNSKSWEGEDNQWHHSYHIHFDNGDQDDDLQDGDVVEEETYIELMTEKMERGRKKSRLSGFDLITEASKMTSPPKNTRNGTTIGETGAKKKLYRDEPEEPELASDDDTMMEELRCNEVLETSPPSPTHVARISSTPSPDVHYGIYMKAKPFDLLSAASLVGDNGNKASSTKDTGSVPLTTDPKPVSVSEATNKDTSPADTAVSAQVDNTNTSSKEGGSSPDVKMTEEVSAENDHDTAMENNEIIEKV